MKNLIVKLKKNKLIDTITNKLNKFGRNLERIIFTKSYVCYFVFFLCIG